MPNWNDWQRTGSEISFVLMLVLLVKLYATGLTRRYCYFSCYLLFESICGPLLLWAKQGTTTYGAIWLGSRPMLWILSVLVLLEVYSLVLARYPGIASLMRWTVAGAAAASATISIVSLTLDFRNPDDPFPLLRCAFAVQRTVDATMAISVLVPLLFMLQFPVRLSRNAVVHCLLFAAMVGTEAGALFLRNWMGHGAKEIGNLALIVSSLVCLAGWIAALNRKGEDVQQPVGPMCTPQMERQLLDQLQSFNAVLLKIRQPQSYSSREEL